DKKLNEREKLRLELSLNWAQKLKKAGDRVLARGHYPPFDATFNDSEYTALFEEFGVDSVVYGHLHGKDCRAVRYLEKNSVKYYLTSCDQVDNKLIKICSFN
ncbi:MAG: metallophosphoesterase, partial [Clostridia bacterium]|nr:metallophosphoesterase [Clostridia bacterium]